MSHVTTAKTHTMTKQEIYGRDDIAIHDAELLKNNIRICLTHFSIASKINQSTPHS